MPRDQIVHGILGKRGFGKSTRLNELVEHDTRVVAWDPLVTPNAPLGQLRMPHRFTSGEECAEWIERYRDRILRCALHSFDAADFGALVRAVHDTGGKLTVAIDEASTLCVRTEPHEDLAWLLAYGRHLDVRVVWTARRPAEVARLCTSQAEILDAFRLDDQADLDALRGSFGRDALRRLPHLERFQFISSEDQ